MLNRSCQEQSGTVLFSKHQQSAWGTAEVAMHSLEL